MSGAPLVGNAVPQCEHALSGLQSVSTHIMLVISVSCARGLHKGGGRTDQTTWPQAFKTEE